MDFSSIFHISSSGMAVEKLRLDVAAINLANMHSSAKADGAVYAPLRLVSRALPIDFSGALDSERASISGGAQVVGVEPLKVDARLVYDPGHPDADEKGFVRYPGVDHLTEMVTINSALRAYEANVAALAAAKAMATRALDIGA